MKRLTLSSPGARSPHSNTAKSRGSISGWAARRRMAVFFIMSGSLLKIDVFFIIKFP